MSGVSLHVLFLIQGFQQLIPVTSFDLPVAIQISGSSTLEKD